MRAYSTSTRSSNIAATASALAAGLVFGIGLTISGMINPQKVLGFLDIAGSWDPTLAFVMGGAILVTLPGFRLLRRRGAPVFSQMFRFPTRQDIDAPLAGGSALFGVGWGLAGFCPGPALAAFGATLGGVASIGSGGIGSQGLSAVLAFVIAMLVGLMTPRLLPGKSQKTTTSKPATAGPAAGPTTEQDG